MVARLAALLAIAIAAVALLRHSAEPAPPSTVAVLPFVNLGEDPDADYFADGMTEDVITQLSNIGGLRVTSRTTVMSYRESGKSLTEIARELRVSAVLEGSVRREGNRVRIVGQLVDAESDTHLWAKTYDRDLEDIFDVQRDVAMAIADIPGDPTVARLPLAAMHGKAGERAEAERFARVLRSDSGIGVQRTLGAQTRDVARPVVSEALG